jgi:adenylate cyclase
MNSLFSELRRRHVFRVAGAYGVVAWLIIQAASIAFPAFGAPAWVLQVAITLAVLGFPIALVLAWAFELTPDGVRRADTLNASGKPTPTRARSVLNARAAGWLGAGILVGLTTVGAYTLVQTPGLAGQSGSGLISVAVLPFANVSTDPADDYFSDGISEEILNAISQIEGLRVSARASSFRFRGADVDLREVSAQLNVPTLLVGSVRRARDRVRVSAQLVNSADGTQIWSANYDREVSDIFAVQQEIAVAIANALQVKLAGGDISRLRRSRTVDPAAYELYLQGRRALADRPVRSEDTRKNLRHALDRFEAALLRDPTFAAAYSGMADAYALLEDYGGLSREEAFPKSIAAAQRALELDELQAEAHASLGHIYYHQKSWDASEREYQRAIQLNPSYATAYHWYSNLLLSLGRLDESVELAARALELDPLSPQYRRILGWKLYFDRQYDRAIAWHEEQLLADPNDRSLHMWLGWTYMSAGRHDEALASMQRVVESVPEGSPDGWARGYLAMAHAAAGRRAEAAAILGQLEAGKPEQIDPFGLAVTYGFLGDQDRAFHWLDKLAERNHHWIMETARIHPTFDPLRPDPRFSRFLEKIE